MLALGVRLWRCGLRRGGYLRRGGRHLAAHLPRRRGGVRGAPVFAFLSPRADSSVTLAAVVPSCPMSTLTAQLDLSDPARLPAAGGGVPTTRTLPLEEAVTCSGEAEPSWPVDWGGLGDRPDELVLARYTMPVPELEAAFADRDALAAGATASPWRAPAPTSPMPRAPSGLRSRGFRARTVVVGVARIRLVRPLVSAVRDRHRAHWRGGLIRGPRTRPSLAAPPAPLASGRRRSRAPR